MATSRHNVEYQSGRVNITSVNMMDDEATPLIHSPVVLKLPHSQKSSSESSAEAVKTRRTLGTIPGVFSPVALAMFSTMLFLRVGFFVGQAGVLESVLQLMLAYTILLLTVLSICAISTNGAVEGGGAYYMISRSLGPEFGGSIGLIFFLANVFCCALYITGVVEGIVENFGEGGLVVGSGGLPVDTRWWKYLYASGVLLICLIISLVGGEMFAKASTLILGVVVICTISVFVSIFAQSKTILVSLPKENNYAERHHLNITENSTIKFSYTGLKASTFSDNLYSDFGYDYSTGRTMQFATVFAVMFSSVTGIMNGANMSGELKDPSRSIPRGTLGAISFTFSTYLALCFLLGASCERKLLLNDYIFLQDINLWPPFVLIGILAATMSAALGNLMGASRILEALANDHLFGPLLKPATFTTKGGNPIVSVFISWVLVQLVLLVGSLNAIAPATSVFFLLSYASTNLACMALDLASAPNFRPTFKFFSWHSSFLGLLGCLVMCFLISAIYTSVAIIVMLLLIIMLHVRSLPTEWGSISQALIFHQVRKYLLMLDIRKSHVKYWRPQVLLMVAKPRQCIELIDFINDIKKGGLYVIGHVIQGELASYRDKDPTAEENRRWMRLVDKLSIKAFVEITLTRTIPEGLQHLIRNAGLGGMKTNTVCLGFYDNQDPVDSLSMRKEWKRGVFGVKELPQYVNIGEKYFPMRKGEKALSPQEYVQMIQDSLKMEKDVLLCRHFNTLKKSQILKSEKVLYINVWPVNFFRLETASFFDDTCLFILQLSCILNMVKGYKSKTCVRVFVLGTADPDSTKLRLEELETFLRQLRILAQIELVSTEDFPTESNFSLSVKYSDCGMQDYHEVSDEFLQSVNKIVNSYSKKTAVTFLYLPRPPQNMMLYSKYLSQLTMLTDDLPPTVLVHGLHPVTSGTL